MKTADAIAWLEELDQTRLPDDEDENPSFYGHAAAAQWVSSGGAALASMFPAGHELRRQWESIFRGAYEGSGSTHLLASRAKVDAGRGVIRVAISMFKGGRVASLLDAVRAETVVELLEQAEGLLASKYVAAATTTAGGALETHLRHLCTRAGCMPKGRGSITAYRDELNKQRNAGNEIISAADADSIGAWGKKRNDASHDPAGYQFASEGQALATLRKDVELMIEGIRQFIARTSGT